MRTIFRLFARVLLPVVAFALGSLAMFGCLRYSVAHAAGLAGDSTNVLASAADASLDVWTKDGPWWAAIAILHVGLRMFLHEQHWLKQGYVLSGLTAAAGVLTALVGWHFSAAPASGIITAIVAGGALLIHPVSAPKTDGGAA